MRWQDLEISTINCTVCVALDVSQYILLSMLAFSPIGSWIHPKEKEEAERKEREAKNNPAPVTPCGIEPSSSPTMAMLPTKPIESHTPNTGNQVTRLISSIGAIKRSEPTDFNGADKQELKNVKQLCLTVLKGQKRLVREVGRVKENVKRHSETLEVDLSSKEASVVSIQHVRDVAENQKKNLRAHLIALDMKEQGKLLSNKMCILRSFESLSMIITLITTFPLYCHQQCVHTSVVWSKRFSNHLKLQSKNTTISVTKVP